jgi:hypothetical protein
MISVTRPLLRLIVLLLVGAVLAPLSGYFAGLARGKELVIWFVATLVGAFVDGTKGVLTMLALPGVFGAMWAWPLTCVVFPLAALFARGDARTPWLFAAIGAVGGAATAYGWIVTGLKPLQAELPGYIAAGVAGGLGAGVLFGLALWRIDAILARPAAASGP